MGFLTKCTLHTLKLSCNKGVILVISLFKCLFSSSSEIKFSICSIIRLDCIKAAGLKSLVILYIQSNSKGKNSSYEKVWSSENKRLRQSNCWFFFLPSWLEKKQILFFLLNCAAFQFGIEETPPIKKWTYQPFCP